MPSSTSSSSSSRPRSSWLQAVLSTALVYILFFSTVCCHAVPVWQTSLIGSRSSTDGVEAPAAVAATTGQVPSRSETGEFDSPDSILQRCAAGELEGTSVFVQTLCSLTMLYSKDNGRTKIHEGYVKRGAGDRTSFSAFNQFVNRLLEHKNEVSDYQLRLNQMQALGILDNDYNVIEVPRETKELMMLLG